MFRVTVGDPTYSAILDPRYLRDPVGGIEDHTAEAHRVAAGGPPMADSWFCSVCNRTVAGGACPRCGGNPRATTGQNITRR